MCVFVCLRPSQAREIRRFRMFRARTAGDGPLSMGGGASTSASTGSLELLLRKGQARRKSKRLSAAFVIGGAVVISIALGSFTLFMSTLTWPLQLGSTCSSGAETRDRNQLARDGGVGVMYICWGSGCDAELICTSVTSLRRAGGWQGKVFVLTDQFDMIERSKARCFGSADSEALPGEMLFNTVRAPEAAHQMLMKDWKRRMFELLPVELSTAIYIDADNFVVGCFEDFLMRHVLVHTRKEKTTEAAVAMTETDTMATQQQEEEKKTGDAETDGKIFMLPDNVCLGCNVFNGGFMAVNRGAASQACLAEWLSETAKGDHKMYKKDQVALDEVLGRDGNACSGTIVELPHGEELYMDYLLLPAVFRGLTTHRNPTLQHFTTGIRRSWMWKFLISAAKDQLENVNR